MNDKTICAVKGVIVRNGKILVMKQEFDWGTFYDLPGGRVERGRPPEEHLKTELKEELGLQVDVGKVLGVSWYLRHTDGDHIVCILYECKPKRYDIDLTKNPCETENITKVMWVTPEEFMKLDPKSLFLRTTGNALKDFFATLKPGAKR